MAMSDQWLKNVVLTAAQKHERLFRNAIGKFEERGVLNSEMLAACSVAEELGVDVFIESGRWRGHSTEILARYFGGKPVQVESIELFRDDNARYVERKMRPYANTTLRYGDANRLIPYLARKYRNKKIAILFDGPKGRRAIDLFRLSLAESPHVIVGFFHDMRQPTETMPNPERGLMEKSFEQVFFTDDTDFVKGFRDLDKSCMTALWKPYSIDGKPIGSYGPTLAVAVPTQRDRQKAHYSKSVLKLKALFALIQSLTVKAYHVLNPVWIKISLE